MADILNIGGWELTSRLFLGTGKFSSNRLIPDVVEASGTQVVTVALRRVDIDFEEENIAGYVPKRSILMPNTSGQECGRLSGLPGWPGLPVAVTGSKSR